jgi:hypothetical protein
VRSPLELRRLGMGIQIHTSGIKQQSTAATC